MIPFLRPRLTGAATVEIPGRVAAVIAADAKMVRFANCRRFIKMDLKVNDQWTMCQCSIISSLRQLADQ
jgi:hypothetical protein